MNREPFLVIAEQPLFLVVHPPFHEDEPKLQSVSCQKVGKALSRVPDEGGLIHSSVDEQS